MLPIDPRTGWAIALKNFYSIHQLCIARASVVVGRRQAVNIYLDAKILVGLFADDILTARADVFLRDDFDFYRLHPASQRKPLTSLIIRIKQCAIIYESQSALREGVVHNVKVGEYDANTCQKTSIRPETRDV